MAQRTGGRYLEPCAQKSYRTRMELRLGTRRLRLMLPISAQSRLDLRHLRLLGTRLKVAQICRNPSARMAPWRLSTLGTSARGTLADRTPPPSRPYVGEIRIRALAIIGHLGDTYAAHGRSINTQRIAEMENCFYARSQEIFTWYCCVGRG